MGDRILLSPLRKSKHSQEEEEEEEEEEEV